MRFLNRKTELDYLNKEYQQPQSNFLVLYGRRRVGKTSLLKEFIQDKPHIYFLTDKQLEVELIRRMQQAIGFFLNDPLFEQIEFRDWEALFRYWLDRADFSNKIVFVIDEFQYLLKANSAFPSILQRLWDEFLQNKNVFLILCGSLIHMMYSSTLSYQSPLYGRRSGQIRLEPLNFLNFKEFFPQLDFQKLVEFYSVIGGVPKYIEVFNPQQTLFENVENFILNKNEYLYYEPRFILSEEITETMTYFSILRTIAEGEHKIGNIAGKLHLSAHNITKYLDKLIDLGIIKRQVPVTEAQPQKSKKGLYFIRDHFFRFWFQYVFPYQSQLELEHISYVLEKVKEGFSRFVAPVFESISLELLAHWNALHRLPFPLEKWGRWWNRHHEIDILAFNTSTKEILFGECKWTNKAVDISVLNHLKEKAGAVEWHKNQRKEYYILFSKSDFSHELKKIAQKEGIFLIFKFP